MIKRWQVRVWLSVLMLVVVAGPSLAAGLITFQLEVVPGFSITAPEQVVFPPVIPGQSSQVDLSMRVWSNVRWNLDLRILGESVGEGLFGALEVKGESGGWSELSAGSCTLFSNQTPTGDSGRDVNIPVRFLGSFRDIPGDYAVQVEFTVVPAI